MNHITLMVQFICMTLTSPGIQFSPEHGFFLVLNSDRFSVGRNLDEEISPSTSISKYYCEILKIWAKMFRAVVSRKLGHRFNSRTCLHCKGFSSVFHEMHFFRAFGFSSTAPKKSLENQTDKNSVPKLERLADELLSLTSLERYDFSILFKLKLGLDRYASPMSGMAMPGAAGGTAATAEQKVVEKTSFDVKLEKYEATAKIKIIKEVRGFTDLGLKEAKELVEKTPAILKKGLTKEEATQIVEKLKELGATAVME